MAKLGAWRKLGLRTPGPTLTAPVCVSSDWLTVLVRRTQYSYSKQIARHNSARSNGMSLQSGRSQKNSAFWGSGPSPGVRVVERQDVACINWVSRLTLLLPRFRNLQPAICYIFKYSLLFMINLLWVVGYELHLCNYALFSGIFVYSVGKLRGYVYIIVESGLCFLTLCLIIMLASSMESMM